MYKYLHDVENRTVYRFPATPRVVEPGARPGWSVSMKIDVTRADNKLLGNQWRHPTSDLREQAFDRHYSREEAVSFFLRRNTLPGEQITSEQYAALQAKYEAIAYGQSGI